MRIDSQRDALIVIDLQPDFMPGGALAVEEGDRVAQPIAELARRFATVVATQDWHPRGHVSFASTHGRAPFTPIDLYGGEQMLWPDHCVAGTAGAALHPALPQELVTSILRKGTRRDVDSYSAFRENPGPDGNRAPTGLAGFLRERGIERIFVCGLARDYLRAGQRARRRRRRLSNLGRRRSRRAPSIPRQARASTPNSPPPASASSRAPRSKARPTKAPPAKARCANEPGHADRRRLPADHAHRARRRRARSTTRSRWPSSSASCRARRNYVLFCGLRSILEHAAQLRLDGDELAGAARRTRCSGRRCAQRPPRCAAAARASTASRARLTRCPRARPRSPARPCAATASRCSSAARRVAIYTPLLQVRTDLLARQADRDAVAGAHQPSCRWWRRRRRAWWARPRGKPVLEFGARRTHPARRASTLPTRRIWRAAARPPTWRRCTATASPRSARWTTSTCRPRSSPESRARQRAASLRGVRRAFSGRPDDARRHLRHRARHPPRRRAPRDGKLAGIRLDSNVTPATVARARALLDELGAPQAQDLRLATGSTKSACAS